MGSKEVTMETKYAAVFASVQAGRESVTRGVCPVGDQPEELLQVSGPVPQ